MLWNKRLLKNSGNTDLVGCLRDTIGQGYVMKSHVRYCVVAAVIVLQ